MNLFKKIFKSEEEKRYKKFINEVYLPFSKEINSIKEKEIGAFFKLILNASEKCLRSLIFMATDVFDFKKKLIKEDFEFWLRKVSLALISYSYYCVISVKNFYDIEKICLKGTSSSLYFKKVINYYNQIFNEHISQKEIDYYASGYKEDIEKGYSISENVEKIQEIIKRDAKIIASELLRGVWHEGINDQQNKGIFLGSRIWEVHKQLVRPFLEKLANKKYLN